MENFLREYRSGTWVSPDFIFGKKLQCNNFSLEKHRTVLKTWNRKGWCKAFSYIWSSLNITQVNKVLHFRLQLQVADRGPHQWSSQLAWFTVASPWLFDLGGWGCKNDASTLPWGIKNYVYSLGKSPSFL